MSFLTNILQSVDPSVPASAKTRTFVGVDGRTVSLNSSGVRNTLTARELGNLLRNGGMWFAQRQAPASLTTYSSTAGRAISADGWGITNENASVQYIRTDTQNAPETGLQGRFYGTWSKITSTGKLFVSQVLEANDCESVRGRTVRFQAWLKASGAKTIKMAALQLNSAGTFDTIPATFISAVGANNVDPTLGTNLAFLAPKSGVTPDNATAGANAASCSVTTAWQRFGVVVDIPTTAKNVIVMIWSDTQFAAADSLSIAQASLTDGYEIQDFSPLPYALELARVQRFYCKTFEIDVLPAGGVAANNGEQRIPSPVTASTAFSGSPEWQFPQRMFKAPTLAMFSPAIAGAVPTNITLGTACTSTSITADGTRGAWWAGTTPASTVQGANVLGVHITADAEI